MKQVTVITSFRKAPVWMKNAVTKFNGMSYTHTGLDTRGTAQSPAAALLAK